MAKSKKPTTKSAPKPKKYPAIRKQYYPFDAANVKEPLEGKNVKYLVLSHPAFKNWIVGVYDMQLSPRLTFGLYLYSVPNSVTDAEVAKKEKKLQLFIANVLFDIMAMTLEYQAEQLKVIK